MLEEDSDRHLPRRRTIEVPKEEAVIFHRCDEQRLGVGPSTNGIQTDRRAAPTSSVGSRKVLFQRALENQFGVHCFGHHRWMRGGPQHQLNYGDGNLVFVRVECNNIGPLLR